MLYTIYDAEGNKVKENADILATNDLDGMAKEFNDRLDPDDDGPRIVGWEEGSYGDCWVKLYQEPKVDSDGYTEVDGIKCRVKKPGTHPGGKAWWAEPVETVFVPKWG